MGRTIDPLIRTEDRAAVIYARFSPRPNAAECDSAQRQVERCEDYCFRQGITVIDTFADEAMSGADDKRPGFVEAIKIAKLNRASIVVTELSRLSRRAANIMQVRDDMRAAGCSFISIREGIDTGDRITGDLLFNMLSVMNEFERAQVSARTSAASVHRRKKGLVFGPTPYGFSRDGDKLVPNQEHRKAMWIIAERRADGWVFERIADHINELGYPSARGGKWDKASVWRCYQSIVKHQGFNRGVGERDTYDLPQDLPRIPKSLPVKHSTGVGIYP